MPPTVIKRLPRSRARTLNAAGRAKAEPKAGDAASYAAESIVVLEGVDAVRRRPAMYLGNPSAPANLAALLTEPFCLGIDEGTGGPASSITLTFHAAGRVSVVNDGPGLPAPDETPGRTSVLEQLMTRLHAGCRAMKVDPKNMDWCRVGVVLVNALSRRCVIRVWRYGWTWEQRFGEGTARGAPRRIGRTRRTGTRLEFTIDRALVTAPLELDLLRGDVDRFRRAFPCISVNVQSPRSALSWWRRTAAR